MNDILAKELISNLKRRDLMQPVNYLHRMDDISSILRVGEEKKSDALVTIIIPAYRRPDLFSYAIKSVLNQKLFSDFQIVIADDSEELASEYEKIVKDLGDDRIRYYKNEKRLGWYNWNRLLELTDTPWVCMLHDDDVLYDKYLYYMKNMLDRSKDADMIVCERIFMQNEEHQVTICEGDIDQVMPRKNDYREWNFRFGSFMLGAWIKREKAVELGGFDDEIISLDYEFLAKMAMHGTVYTCPLPIYGYGVKANESMKADMWEKMLISEFYICNSMIRHRNFLLRPILRKIEQYSIACHAEDMSHPSKNIYGVEMDAERLCSWLNVKYSLRNSLLWKTMMKLHYMMQS